MPSSVNLLVWSTVYGVVCRRLCVWRWSPISQCSSRSYCCWDPTSTRRSSLNEVIRFRRSATSRYTSLPARVLNGSIRSGFCSSLDTSTSTYLTPKVCCRRFVCSRTPVYFFLTRVVRFRCCLESWRTCLARHRPCARRLFLACSMSQRCCSVYLYAAVSVPCIVLRVAYSACLDVAIFGFANQVFWRLFCHVRLCCCLLVECDLFTCCRELAWIRRGCSFGG